jgi:hypothetical protein
VRIRRVLVSVCIAALTLALLGSCSVPQLAWFRVHDDVVTGFAACNEYARVDAIRVSVPDSRGHEVAWQTFGGPALSVGTDTELDFENLPVGWASLGNATVDAAGKQPRIYLDAFTNGEIAFSRSMDIELAAGDGWFTNVGWTQCPHDRGTRAPEFSALISGLTGPNAARAAVGHEPMSSDTFWSLLSPQSPTGVVSRTDVRARLDDLTLDELKAFDARLLLEVFDLDTFAAWSAVQAQWDGYFADPENFLAARLDLIEAGETVVEAAKTGDIADDVLSKSGDQWLMQVAHAVARARGERLDSSSYRLPTGVALNQSGWTAPAP